MSSANHKINHFHGNLTTLLKTTFPHLARVKHRQITSTQKNLRFLDINHRMEIFLNSHNQFIQDPGCKPAVEKETWSPHFPNNFLLVLWPGQKSASISFWPNRFHT